MAITAIEYLVMRTLKERGALPPNPSVLELGESNWYGDMAPEEFLSDLEKFAPSDIKQEIIDAARAQLPPKSEKEFYALAKLFFRGFLGFKSLDAIDPATPGSTYRLDLNLPVSLDRQFDILLNYGTAEHVFNVMQFFKTTHELTVPGGLMIHGSPFTGWIEHGFYNFNPTFFFDLALANGYEILLMAIAQIKPFVAMEVSKREDVLELAQRGQIPPNAMIDVAFRKPPDERPFAAPMQGYYAGVLSPQAKKAWETLR
jgi:hypothetical protein